MAAIMRMGTTFFPGYLEIKPSGEPSHETSKFDWHLDYNNVLYAMWLLRLCSIWKWCTREFPHRVRLLRAVLANRLSQHLHRRALNWSISGKQSLLFPASVLFYGILAFVHEGCFLFTGFLPTNLWIRRESE